MSLENFKDGRLPYAEAFHELAVYRKARVLAREIFIISREFPREESFSLTDQIRRSARSIGAQIAEAGAKRRYSKHFVSKLSDADGEQQERSIGSCRHSIAMTFPANKPTTWDRKPRKSAACSEK